MDLKLKLSSFEPQIEAVSDIIELCRAAHIRRSFLKSRLVFASLIAVVGRYSKVSTTGANVPEVSMENPLTTLPIGYAETKWCCENIVQNAHTSFQYEMKAMIVRMGQLSESVATGFWSEKEHIAALVGAFQDVQAVPNL